MAGAAATGDAEGAYTGQSAGQVVHEFNYLNHDDMSLALEKFKGCNGENECENKVIREALELSEEKDRLAQVACEQSNPELCKLHEQERLTLFEEENVDGYFEQIGEDRTALALYQVIKQENVEANALMADATTQGVVKELYQGTGLDTETAEILAAGTGILSTIGGSGKRKAVDGDNSGTITDDSGSVAEVSQKSFNRANHIFGPKALEKHKLGSVLEKFSGDNVKAFQAIEKATQNLANDGIISDTFEAKVSVKGIEVTVRGKVIDGNVNIGTAFIP
ncbi:hypothetical protein [Vibrio sonorensis]|uniref:hypothetical protein n=1 Tax=Vibrio sonorensis TaxID=1004316 RepID=UPI0008DADB62|nr:hypothetical protein [Vibrio sonorensis]